MKRKTLLCSIAALLLAVFSYAGNFTRQGNVVTVNVLKPMRNGARQVRLEVINSKIIRVQATPDGTFSNRKSLIVLPQSTNTPFDVVDGKNDVKVTTDVLAASISKEDGRITFLDKNGAVLLREANRGKTFKSITVDEKRGVTWHALFDSNNDEAFYGLGQHQANEMNYKGKNEDLFQYNTKVSVPFVMSNHNYGLLWDSYSYCRFGQPEPYKQLNRIFKLFDKNGKAGGLTGVYVQADGKTVIRTEDSIYYEDFRLIKNLPQNFRYKGAKVTYQGFVEAERTALYRFILYYAGYIKVYLDNRLSFFL